MQTEVSRSRRVSFEDKVIVHFISASPPHRAARSGLMWIQMALDEERERRNKAKLSTTLARETSRSDCEKESRETAMVEGADRSSRDDSRST